MDYKKGLLWAGLGAIGVSALITVAIFLFGSFSETQTKLILATLTLGFYSLICFASSSWKEKRFSLVGILGIVSSVLAALMALRYIWVYYDYWNWTEGEIKFTWIINILMFAAAYSTILLRSVTKKVIVNVLAYAASSFISTASLMMIFLIITNFNIALLESEIYLRLMVSFTALGVAGALALPIVKKIYATNLPEPKKINNLST